MQGRGTQSRAWRGTGSAVFLVNESALNESAAEYAVNWLKGKLNLNHDMSKRETDLPGEASEGRGVELTDKRGEGGGVKRGGGGRETRMRAPAWSGYRSEGNGTLADVHARRCTMTSSLHPNHFPGSGWKCAAPTLISARLEPGRAGPNPAERDRGRAPRAAPQTAAPRHGKAVAGHAPRSGRT